MAKIFNHRISNIGSFTALTHKRGSFSTIVAPSGQFNTVKSPWPANCSIFKLFRGDFGKKIFLQMLPQVCFLLLYSSDVSSLRLLIWHQSMLYIILPDYCYQKLPTKRTHTKKRRNVASECASLKCVCRTRTHTHTHTVTTKEWCRKKIDWGCFSIR